MSVISCSYVAGPHFVVYEFPSKEAVAQFKNEIAQMNQTIDDFSRHEAETDISSSEG